MQFQKLFEPGRIGNLELKNRIIMAPMITRYVNDDGTVSERMVEYYRERARGGCAMVTVEASNPRSGGYPGRIYVGGDECISGLKTLAKAIHEGGAKACIQINTHRGMDDEVDPASACESIHPIHGKVVRALSARDLRELEAGYGEAARRVREAGFDCLMIHGGYLIAEFVSPVLNHRTDEYGGNLDNRVRFALGILTSARERAGLDFPIIYRLPCERKPGAGTGVIYKLPYDERMEGEFRVDQAIEVSRRLENAGACAINLTSASVGYPKHMGALTMLFPRGVNAVASGEIKKQVRIPVSVNGSINDPRFAEEILAAGKADFVELGRPLVADPHFPSKARSGNPDDIRKCMLCNRCIESIFRPPVGPMVCSVNPSVGREKEFETKLKPAAEKKKVLVVGGGPAGMEAAVTAAVRGHDVTLWEQRADVGGEINIALVPPGKEELRNLSRYLERQLGKCGVRVQLRTTAETEAILGFSPDAVVLAVGSTPVMPKIRGMERGKVFTFRDVLSGTADVGKTAVVVGGGFVGCETAEFLSEKGKKVTLVEVLPRLASDLFAPLAEHLIHRLQTRNIDCYTGVQEELITENGMELIDKEGKKIAVEADSIVLAVGSKPNRSLSASLQGKVPMIFEIGDCREIGRVYEAIVQGAEAGFTV